MPGSTALLEGAVAPAAVPESICVPCLALRLGPPRGSCEADTRISVAVSFRVCFGGAVFSFKGSLPPLNHRKKPCSTVFMLAYVRESILKARSFVLLYYMSSFIFCNITISITS